MSNTYAQSKYWQTSANNNNTSQTYPVTTDTLSANIISDLGIASLLAGFLAPAIIPLAGLPVIASIGAETALTSTGAGIELLYPQAYNTITQYVPKIPATSVALGLIGMTSVTVGAYYLYNQNNKKKNRR